MPKAVAVATEEEMKALVQSLKDNQELSVTRVRELLKVGYTKARRLLDEAVAGEVYVPPVDVPSSTADKDVLTYIKKLITENREVKPDILRRDLNIGYKRAKRLIDSLGGNRAGVTVIPPIARKRRTGKKKKVVGAEVKTSQPTAAKRRRQGAEEGSTGAIAADSLHRPAKRRKAEKRVPVHVEQPLDESESESEVEDDEDENDIEGKIKAEVEEESLNSEEERVAECIVDKRRRNHKVEYLLKWVGLPESENSWSSAHDAGCEDLVPAFEEQRKEKGRGHRRSNSSHAHDESHAHIMLMLHQGDQPSGKEEEEEVEVKKEPREHGHHHHHSEREHGHHHHGEREHGHHHHSSHHKEGEHGHARSHHHHHHGEREHGHHHHSHHGHHHSSHHKEGGHHHHHSHHHRDGHSHHHSHGHHHHHHKPKVVEAKRPDTEVTDDVPEATSCSASDSELLANEICENSCCVSTTAFVDGVIADESGAPAQPVDATAGIKTPPSVTSNINALSEFIRDTYPLSSLSTSSISISTDMDVI